MPRGYTYIRICISICMGEWVGVSLWRNVLAFLTHTHTLSLSLCSYPVEERSIVKVCLTKNNNNYYYYNKSRKTEEEKEQEVFSADVDVVE